MLSQLDNTRTYNEEVYDQLTSLIENSQGRLAPIIVACDDSELRQRIISRYESEAQQVQIRPYQIALGQEPSMRAELEALRQQDPYLQQGGKAVFTVTGAGLLLRVKLNHEDQSQLDKFFGYLQWTREGLREFRYPIVLWVTQQILREISHRAPDFWSWRKAVLRFADESPYTVQRLIGFSPSQPTQENSATEFLPPLKELQAEIIKLTAKNSDAPGLATLYNQLGRIYAQRIQQGKAENLEKEKEQAINAFQQAISRYQAHDNRLAEANTLSRLGKFFYQQCHYSEAIALYQQVLAIDEQIGNLHGKAATLHQLAILKANQGEVEEAIALYQQSLQLTEQIGDVQTKAATLHQLAILKANQGEVEEAIALYQQSLQLQEQIGDIQGKAATLHELASIKADQGAVEEAIALYQQSLKFEEHIGDVQGKAATLHELARIQVDQGAVEEAIALYQQSLQLQEQIGDVQGKAAALHELARIKAKQEEVEEAIALYHQALVIDEKIGNVQGKAATLAMLGQLLAHGQGDIQTALAYLQESLTIFQHLRSPKAATVTSIIQRIQNLAH